ncbi:glycosyltransferase [Clostridium malenominatum]|uniref:Glycosyltransferase n=1 Tax=Clostridium malenominatum TaxID=1539 RepID=A0ABP3TYA0_9CLOT
MRVIYCIRNDYLRNFAGDSMQALKSAEHLRKMGVHIDINNGHIEDYSSYDLVHLFNLTRTGETYKYYKIGKYYKKTILLSPMYWDLKKYYDYEKDLEGIRMWGKCAHYRSEILKGCRIIYPNSESEGELLRKEFGKYIKYEVIHDGVEVEDDQVPLYNFKDRYNLENYILCVGRICKIKNQLTLAKICNNLNLRLVLIGNIDDKDYFNECMKYKNVTYLGFMDSYNIYNAYRFAKLHASPSFIEIPGISSLEAAASGCNILTTKEGSAYEYFGDEATYCNPFQEESITKGVLEGINKRKDNNLKNHILDYYNWNKCIEKLYESYKAILG